MPLSEEEVARQSIAIRLKQQLAELSGEIQKWRGRVDLARQQGQIQLAEAAEARLGELMARGRTLWKQLDELQLEARLEQLEIDDELARLKEQFKS